MIRSHIAAIKKYSALKILTSHYVLYLQVVVCLGLYDEVVAMRKACGEAHLKTILATGELGTMSNVYKASIVCMLAGKYFYYFQLHCDFWF